MCSIILHRDAAGIFIAANRDEMKNRPWDAPAEYWPGICGGRDRLGGGSWAALNRAGVFAALLNRHGTLGPAPGKRSRGELPLLALAHDSADKAAAALAGQDAEAYRSFNLVIADASAAYLLRGLGDGLIDAQALTARVTMITSGEPNERALPRIARHLPRFEAQPRENWKTLLADASGTREEQLNIPAPADGFGTVCALLVDLPKTGPATQCFAPGPPDRTGFNRLDW
ncbi:NRDE family protein [Acidocella sp. MX-AZ02]|uniref:NRDE family protein n=1 Tax=Acidocella sp. MX-AZ02 TaxID=1214225 RepID=UPI00028EB60F|nr:NRDE family protein [Acidocella sp. MX-AZ02]EKN00608.1 hypothetical protein MXAZACID_04597 [Acidocella sp. MX-AZ02]